MSHHHDHEEGWDLPQEPRNDQPRTESRGEAKRQAGGKEMAEFTVEIDSAMLIGGDGIEYEPVAMRPPLNGDYYLTSGRHGTEPFVARLNGEWTDGPRLILRPRPWRPKEGEECLFMRMVYGTPELYYDRWDENCAPRLAAGTCWPLSRRAEAEACVERVRKAIGGAK
jgi:hypothetical protein